MITIVMVYSCHYCFFVINRRNNRPTWKYNNTAPVAGNYYPVNSRIFIRVMVITTNNYYYSYYLLL